MRRWCSGGTGGSRCEGVEARYEMFKLRVWKLNIDLLNNERWVCYRMPHHNTTDIRTYLVIVILTLYFPFHRQNRNETHFSCMNNNTIINWNDRRRINSHITHAASQNSSCVFFSGFRARAEWRISYNVFSRQRQMIRSPPEYRWPLAFRYNTRKSKLFIFI